MLNVYQRINKVREELAYLKKDKEVQGYKAVTHDLVTSEIRPFLVKHGIVVVVNQKSGELCPAGKETSNGTPITITKGMYQVEYVNIDDPADRVNTTIFAAAEDHGDKGPGKACSYAVKTSILKTFSLETGESDESRQELKPKPITEAQAKELKSLIADADVEEARFLEYYKIGAVEHLPKKAFAAAVRVLKKKAEGSK